MTDSLPDDHTIAQASEHGSVAPRSANTSARPWTTRRGNTRHGRSSEGARGADTSRGSTRRLWACWELWMVLASVPLMAQRQDGEAAIRRQSAAQAVAGQRGDGAAEQAVRDANAALLTATRSGAPGAYARLLADDLQWVAPDGRVLTKRERVASEGRSGITGRVFDDVSVTVSGDVATLVARSTWTTSSGARMSERVLRVFVYRAGVWQLFRHAAVATPADR
jgi:ketosteroid isomerase-like protein